MSQTFYKKGFLALAVATALGVSSYVQADVKIGVAGPMTGANAAFGEQYMKGAQAAADKINAAGGVNGEKIVLVKGDDACEQAFLDRLGHDVVGNGFRYGRHVTPSPLQDDRGCRSA